MVLEKPDQDTWDELTQVVSESIPVENLCPHCLENIDVVGLIPVGGKFPEKLMVPDEPDFYCANCGAKLSWQ